MYVDDVYTYFDDVYTSVDDVFIQSEYGDDVYASVDDVYMYVDRFDLCNTKLTEYLLPDRLSRKKSLRMNPPLPLADIGKLNYGQLQCVSTPTTYCALLCLARQPQRLSGGTELLSAGMFSWLPVNISEMNGITYYL